MQWRHPIKSIRASTSGTKRILVVVLGFTLAACVPFVTSEYYRPHSVEGRSTEATCPPDPAFWLIERGGVVVGTRINDGKHTKIDMTFEIPEGKNVRLLCQMLTVTTSSGKTLQGELTGRVMPSHGRSQKVSAGELLIGGDRGLFGPGYSPYFRIFHNLYWFSVSLDIRHPDQLAVRFPSFLVNGVEESLPVINFILDTDFRVLESLNC